jgi:hypothetical protein
MHISKKTTSFITVTMSREEFRQKLGIPDTLRPFRVSLSFVDGVVITCSGEMPEPVEQIEAAAPEKKTGSTWRPWEKFLWLS